MKPKDMHMHYIQYLAEKYQIKSMKQAEPEYMTLAHYTRDYEVARPWSNTVIVEIDLEALAHLAKKIYEQDNERALINRHPAVTDAYDKYQTLVALYKGVV